MFLLKVELDYILRKSKRLLIYSLHVQQSELQIKKVIKKWSQEGSMYTYGWFMLRSDRKQKSVKQLSFN